MGQALYSAGLTMFGLTEKQLFSIVTRLVLCVGIYLVCAFVINRLTKFLVVRLLGKGADDSMLIYFTSILRFTMKLILVLVLVAACGIGGSSVAAAIAAVAGGIVLAAQDTLKDFISGVALMSNKPFAVGDYVRFTGAALEGWVEKITLFQVTLKGRGGRRIIIPNHVAERDSCINYAKDGFWVMDPIFGISYDDSIQAAREAMIKAAAADPEVIEGEGISVQVESLGDSSVNLMLQCKTRAAEHFPALYRINESVKAALKEAGVTIVYNQLDVHIKEDGRAEGNHF